MLTSRVAVAAVVLACALVFASAQYDSTYSPSSYERQVYRFLASSSLNRPSSYYPLNDIATYTSAVNDRAGSGYDGTYVGFSSGFVALNQTGANAIDRSAYYLQAGGSIQVPRAAVVGALNAESSANDIAIEFWFKPNNFPWTNLDSDASVGRLFAFTSLGAAQSLYINLYSSNVTVSLDSDSYSGPVSVSSGQWNHLVLNIADDASNSSRVTSAVFINGSQVASGWFLKSVLTVLNVGTTSTDKGIFQLGDGWMDEIAIYGRALTAAEIADRALYGRLGQCRTFPCASGASCVDATSSSSSCGSCPTNWSGNGKTCIAGPTANATAGMCFPTAAEIAAGDHGSCARRCTRRIHCLACANIFDGQPSRVHQQARAGCERAFRSSTVSDARIGADLIDDVATDGALSTTSFNIHTQNSGSRSCADGGDAVYYGVSDVASNGFSVQVAQAPSTGCLRFGDWVLVIVLQGPASVVSSIGQYEFLRVDSVSGRNVYFQRPLTKTYPNPSVVGSSLIISLQRVPYYSSASVIGTWTGNAFDGATGGGVFAIRTKGNMTVSGNINMNGKGFRGGQKDTSANNYGAQGESYVRGSETTSLTSTSRFTGNYGGGGGGNPGTPGPYWPTGGGGGSYGTAGGSGAATGCANAPPLVLGGTDLGYNTGRGGATYGDAQLSTIFFGSGGGSGGSYGGHPPGSGGSGGGIVMLFSDQNLFLTGTVDSVGADGEMSRSSGAGGAGGAVLLVSRRSAPNTGRSAVSGGSGQFDSYCNGSGGKAGNGGSGRVRGSQVDNYFV